MLRLEKPNLLRTACCILLYLGMALPAFSQVYSSTNPQFNWGPWTQNSCFKGIYIRVQKAYFNKTAKQWYWNWQIQNRYAKRVAISWVFFDSTQGKPSRTNSRHTFEPNEIWKNGNFGSETELSWIFEDACFAFKTVGGALIDDCSHEPRIYRKGYYYAECDDGLPRYQAYTGASASNPNTGSALNNTGSNQNYQQQEVSSQPTTVYDSHSGVVAARFNGSLASFIGNNLRYPEKAIENNIQGKVNVKIIIETDGSITAMVIDGPAELRAEALRVVKLSSGNWIPATLNQAKVRYSLILPITFNLSD